ncbi:MAG: hypothetical protein HY064_10400 [Bacteroidetes bacterium]|nr:hypothetical protein [Bacteroidota bacterium]
MSCYIRLMKNNFRLLSICLFFILASCGNEQKTQNTTMNNKKDSTVAKIIDTLTIAQHLGGDTLLCKDPSLIAFAYDAKLEKHKRTLLKSKEVRKKFYPLVCGKDESILFYFERYFQLDSLGVVDETEEDFHEGDIVDEKIYFIDSIKISPAYNAVCWAMTYKSFEADPYSEGTFYMLTTFTPAGKQIETIQLGETSMGADPPVAGNTHIYSSVFKDASFKMISSDSVWEDEETYPDSVEVQKKVYVGKFDPGGRVQKKIIDSVNLKIKTK